jgi:hypothetical protein
MAIEVSPNQTIALLHRYLDPSLRYRCLIIIGHDIGLLSQVSNQIYNAGEFFGQQIQEIVGLEQFDQIGAFSCDSIISKIKSISFKHPLIITGPLHFLDYWPPSLRTVFWQFLSAFSNGPGIVVTDVYRTETIQEPLQMVEGFSRTDLRCLKSRLEFTQDRLA